MELLSVGDLVAEGTDEINVDLDDVAGLQNTDHQRDRHRPVVPVKMTSPGTNSTYVEICSIT